MNEKVIHPVKDGAIPPPRYIAVKTNEQGMCFVLPDRDCNVCHGKGEMIVSSRPLACPTCHRGDEKIGDDTKTVGLCAASWHAPDAVAQRKAQKSTTCNCVRRRIIAYFERIRPAPERMWIRYRP